MAKSIAVLADPRLGAGMFYEIHSDNIESRISSKSMMRLLEMYRQLVVDSIPDYADFNPTKLEMHRNFLTVAMAQPDGDFLITYAGASLTALLNLHLTGLTTSTGFSSDLGAFLAEGFAKAAALAQPLFTLHRSADLSEIEMWERLILPVRVGKEGVGFVAYSAPRSMQADLVQALFGASDDGIIGTIAERDAQGRLVDIRVQALNLRASGVLGVALSVLEGAKLLEAAPMLRGEGVWTSIVAAVEKRQTRSCELRIASDKGERWLKVTIAPLNDGAALQVSDITATKQTLLDLDRQRNELTYANQVLGAQAEELSEIAFEAEIARAKLSEEIARREQLEQELNRLARSDVLTGVMNRLGFEEVARYHIAAAQRYNNDLSIILVDADHFKAVNDKHGHAGGDLALVHLANILLRGIRFDVDCVGRIGGEEFAIILPQTGIEGAMRLAERLRARLAATPVNVGAKTITLTASFGVASFCNKTGNLETLLQRADRALYAAKHAGRNRVVAGRKMIKAA